MLVWLEDRLTLTATSGIASDYSYSVWSSRQAVGFSDGSWIGFASVSSIEIDILLLPTKSLMYVHRVCNSSLIRQRRPSV